MINKVILLGYLGQDPKSFSDGKVAKFSIATKHSYKNQKGEWVDETEWTDCVGFGGYTKAIMNLKKGDLVYVEGRKQTNKYTDKNKVERYGVAVVIEQLRSTHKSAGAEKQKDEDEPEWLMG